MQKKLNLKVKYRESFRPFAPAVLREDAAQWFELDGDSPYMLLVAEVAERHRRATSEAERNLFGIAVSPGRGLYFVDAYGGAPGLPADTNRMVAPPKDH